MVKLTEESDNDYLMYIHLFVELIVWRSACKNKLSKRNEQQDFSSRVELLVQFPLFY